MFRFAQNRWLNRQKPWRVNWKNVDTMPKQCDKTSKKKSGVLYGYSMFFLEILTFLLHLIEGYDKLYITCRDTVCNRRFTLGM